MSERDAESTLKDIATILRLPDGWQPSDVVQRVQEIVPPAPSSRAEAILAAQWFALLKESVIVAEVPLAKALRLDDPANVEYYGGLLVCESCDSSVRRHIIDLHNASLNRTINP